MSQAASQAAAFYRDVASNQKLWTVEDDVGIPAPMTSTGRRSMPFWSSLSRVKKVISTAPAYSGFRPRELTWSEFVGEWVGELKQDGYLVGVNWSGPRVRGYDCEPDDVVRNVSCCTGHLSAENARP